jgi:hypothetical protein
MPLGINSQADKPSNLLKQVGKTGLTLAKGVSGFGF